MIQTRLLSKTLRSFTKSSKSLAKSVHEKCRQRRIVGFFCFYLLRRPGEIPRENQHVGGSNSKMTLSELMKLQEDDGDEEKEDMNRFSEIEQEEEKEPGRGAELKLQKEKEPDRGADFAMLVEEVKERERRVKASYEALARLIEVEVMEASDVEQILDLKEVFSDYPLITNHFLVDLMNTFILDVSNSILPART